MGILFVDFNFFFFIFLQEVFELVWFFCMNKEYLENVVLKDEFVFSEDNWEKLVEDVIMYLIFLLMSKKKMVMKRKFLNVLYLIGELFCWIEIFDLEIGICKFVFSMVQMVGSVVVVNEEFYVVLGGGMCVQKYDLKLNFWV